MMRFASKRANIELPLQFGECHPDIVLEPSVRHVGLRDEFDLSAMFARKLKTRNVS